MTHRSSSCLLLVAAAACGGSSRSSGPPSLATPRQLSTAAASILPATVQARIGVIAHDSMGGRNTPSPGLEKTAQYLAGLYQSWGLRPAGENGTWFQRYALVRRRLDGANSYLEANEAGTITRFPLSRWAMATGPRTGTPISGKMLVLSGAITAKEIEPLTLTGMIVYFVQNPSRGADNARVVTALRAKVPAAIVLVQSGDPVAFAAAVTRSAQGNQVLDNIPMPTAVTVVTVHDSLLANAANVRNRPDWEALRASATPVVMEVPDEVRLTIVVKEEEVSRVTAPNVVAMIPGSDPALSNEYVVYSAHMDHVGTVGDGVGGCGVARTNPADSICNGADDDASGTTAIAMIGEAFARLRVKPKRSIIILNVSGEEKGLLGAQYYSEHPTVPREQIVANLNFDMVGRNNPDSIVVIGKEHSDLGATLATVAAAHPELRLTTADDMWPNERFYFRSDHYHFARKGVPILFFFNGVHPQYHQPSDEVALIDYGKLARVATMGFYLGNAIANAPGKPQWNAESYKQIVEGPGR